MKKGLLILCILATILFSRSIVFATNAELCVGLINVLDYNNDNHFDLGDLLWYTDQLSEVDFNCLEGKVCDLGRLDYGSGTNEDDYTQFDLSILTYLLDNNDFPPFPNVVFYTLDDFCGTTPSCGIFEGTITENTPYTLEDITTFATAVDTGSVMTGGTLTGDVLTGTLIGHPGLCSAGEYALIDTTSTSLSRTCTNTLETITCEAYQIIEQNECYGGAQFDYNNDGYLTRDDSNLLANRSRYGNDTNDCDGEILAGRYTGIELCCPANKICDIYCHEDGYSNGIVHSTDSLRLFFALKQGDLPSSVCSGIPMCEDDPYVTEGRIRMNLPVDSYLDTTGVTDSPDTCQDTKYEKSTCIDDSLPAILDSDPRSREALTMSR